MNVPRPDYTPVGSFLARLRRRLALRGGAIGAGAGLALAAAIAFLFWPGEGSLLRTVIAGVALAATGMLIGIMRSVHPDHRLAAMVERRAPGCRNVVFTAAELLHRPGRARADISALVFRDAERHIGALDVAALFPAGRAVATLMGGAVLWVAAMLLVTVQPVVATPPLRIITPAEVAISAVDVVITPPAYSARPADTLSNPVRVEALAGSRVRISVRATAAAVSVETVGGRSVLTPDGTRFSGEIIADGDGYIAIEATSSDDVATVRRLIGLAVTPDQPPRVRITRPGSDLFLPAARGALAVAIEADDDIGLASLRLRYTRVSGSGEQFTFTDGEVPLRLTRTDSRNWTGSGSLPLGDMELIPGDVVVYRGIATDNRPGAVPAESDSYIVEITSPGSIASEGFAIDDEFDRYAVSQQMVILKTEQLLARRAVMRPEEFATEAVGIAAEQRRVRAQFVFMMGGELAEEVIDAVGISHLEEEHEAEAEDDILAGRLANRGRVEIVRAIRAMSHADASLIATEVEEALEQEKLALDHLQRAFSRTRYILRALTLRERLDLSRRLTGALGDAMRDVRPVAETTADPATLALRAALSGIAELAASGQAGADASARASAVARSILQADPVSPPLQEIAGRVSDASTALARSRAAEAAAALERAAIGLAAVLRERLAAAPPVASEFGLGRLDGALADMLRQQGGVR